jgi:hypothetical protein
MALNLLFSRFNVNKHGIRLELLSLSGTGKTVGFFRIFPNAGAWDLA